jgi:hypothetical protein
MTFQLPSYHILGYLSIPMFSTPPHVWWKKGNKTPLSTLVEQIVCSLDWEEFAGLLCPACWREPC